MDSFDKKHEMIQLLMQMLKKNAADEVGGYSEKQQLTNTPVPTHSIADMPHKKEAYQPGSAPAHGAKPMEGTSMGNMAEGGLVGTDMHASDEASRLTEPVAHPSDDGASAEALKNLPGPVEDEAAEKDAAQKMHNENMLDEDEDNNSSSFEAFFPRKKKK